MSSRRLELGALYLAASIGLSAFGELAMKVGMARLHDLIAHIPALGLHFLASPAVLWTGAGLASYGLSMLCWLMVLSRYPLSFAYPMLGLSYVLVYFGATTWLGEAASLTRSLGTLLIVVGVALVSLSGEHGGSMLDEPNAP